MEVERNIKPENNFLHKVRSLCSKNNVVLIFDECTTGFRETLGGLHKKYKVNPDICIFGKALGNGFPITAIIGRIKIMKNVKNTFISSTFWTDRIGSVAALKTIDIIERKKTFNEILKISSKIKKNWITIAKKNNLEIEIFGINSILKFKFKSNNNNLYKGIITHLMLKKGFLANTTIYVSIAHTKKILDKYFKELDKIFSIIEKIEKKIISKNKYKIKLPISDFKRFN
jgi:glutamate-1-semialdehyde aminotransferase